MDREERKRVMAEDKEYQQYKKLKQKLEEQQERERQQLRTNMEIAFKTQKQKKAKQSEKVKYKKYAFWVSVAAAVLPVLNFILCVKKVKATWNVQENGALGISDMVQYYMNNYMNTVVFWISVVLMVMGMALLCISYLKNTVNAGKTVMIVCRCIQAECLQILLLLLYIDRLPYSIAAITELLTLIPAVLFAIGELVVFVLYMLDKFHRKTCGWIILLSAWTIFNIYFGIAALGAIGVYILIIMILPAPVPERHLVDTATGHEIVERWY